MIYLEVGRDKVLWQQIQNVLSSLNSLVNLKKQSYAVDNLLNNIHLRLKERTIKSICFHSTRQLNDLILAKEMFHLEPEFVDALT